MIRTDADHMAAVLLRQREAVLERIAFTQRKLDRFKTILEQTAFAMGGQGDFRFYDGNDGFTVLAISGVQGFEENHVFPRREDICRALKDRASLNEDLAQINKTLLIPD